MDLFGGPIFRGLIMTQNLTRGNHYNQKVNLSVFTAEEVSYTALTADSDEGSIFFVLPPNSVLFKIIVIAEELANPAAKFHMTIGGLPVITNGPLDATSTFHAEDLDNNHFDSSGDVIIKSGGSPPTQGRFTFIVTYVEYKLHNGQYTRYSDN